MLCLFEFASPGAPDRDPDPAEYPAIFVDPAESKICGSGPDPYPARF